MNFKQISQKTKLYLFAGLICLGFVFVGIYPYIPTKKDSTSTKEKDVQTPTYAIERFMTTLIASETTKLPDYLTQTAKEKHLKGYDSIYIGIINMLVIPQPPLSYEIKDLSYNKEQGVAILKLNYSKGFLKRTFHLKYEGFWKIDKVETIDPKWTYQIPTQNIEFKYPLEWLLQTSNLGTETTVMVTDVDEKPSITFLATQEDLPEEFTTFLSCEQAQNSCEKININNIQFTKVENTIFSQEEALLALTATKNEKNYVIFGIIQKQNYEEEKKAVEQIFDTILISQ